MATYTTIRLAHNVAWPVPAGVSLLTVKVRGAKGQSANDGAGVSDNGGYGAGPMFTLPVMAGQQLFASLGYAAALGSTVGGSPNGRASSSGYYSGWGKTLYGGPGGGRTDLKLDGVLLAVGGAGGGGTKNSGGLGGYWNGGNGGTPDGQPGQIGGGGAGTAGGGASQAADGTNYGTAGLWGGGGDGYKRGGSGQDGPGGGGSSWADVAKVAALTWAADNYSDGYVEVTYRDPITPTAPIIVSPQAGDYVASGTVRLRWQYPMEDTQSAGAVEYRPIGGSTLTGSVAGATNYVDVPLGAGSFEWRAKVTSGDGFEGPFSPWTPFTSETPPADPVITTPAVGATIADTSSLVQWTATGQQAWQAQTLIDGAIAWDSGQVVESATRQVMAGFPTNGAAATVRLRIRGAHVWTNWITVAVTVAWVGPPAPLVTLAPDPDDGCLRIMWAQPAGTPIVDHYYVQAVEDGTLFPVAAGLAATVLAAVFWQPRSDVDTAIRVSAVATNGTETVTEVR